jgi:cysteinyl-tRNA synthetase
MKIYNSLTKRKEEFKPINPGIVNIYTCGVTVYDDCHIGHARSLYIFDMMRRYLEYKGYKVNFVRNITDIDDKIINRANELRIGWRELVGKYIVSYREDLKGLGVSEGLLDKDGEEPRATKNIPDMIRYIAVLVDKGYAYEAGGDVYFDLHKFTGYGKLSGQNIDKAREGVRILPDEKKKDALDFVLWKKSKENEPWWDSPWSKGRPGWHIECSVMSRKFLNADTLDIHAGGRDLIFPHHENEIAQAETRTGKPFAKYWIHHGLLTIENQKMAKSMGNFITIKDALKRYPVDALKIFYLQAHYSSSIDFSEKKMAEAKAALERFHVFFDKIKRQKNCDGSNRSDTKKFRGIIDTLRREFTDAMDDDFNTPQALSKLFEMVSQANIELENNDIGAEYAKDTIMDLAARIFNLFSKQEKIPSGKKRFVESKIIERNRAGKAGDFAEADRIREELRKEGIILEDSKGWVHKPALEGTRWRPI